MTGPFTPWGTMPFKVAALPTIDELNSRGTSSLLTDKEAGEAPPPASPASPFPQGRAVRSGATATAGAGDEPAPAFSSEVARPLRPLRGHLPRSAGEDLVPASFLLSHASRLLLRLVALHERISEGEALARAVAFYAADHLKLRDLASACEDHRAGRAAGHRNCSESS